MLELSKIDIIEPGIRPIEPMPNQKIEPTPLDFNVIFKNAMTETNALDNKATRMVEMLATGKTNDVSGVMMAVQKANLSFNMVLQIRNKIVEAYEEVMRMRM